ncbi:MAG: ATP-dependent RecD-like DNA helicase [Clostridia bacterium]|nr:ATP-dependent RecD-like DNA helicase [Clostridia bacterium]
MEITGTITAVRYRNEENGWTVLSLETDDDKSITAVGAVPSVSLGERASISGEWTSHPLYGEQIKITSFKVDMPTSAETVLAYLSSGFLKGVGKSTARLIVDRFGPEALDVIKLTPNELTKISGIGLKKAKQIHESYLEKAQMQDIVIGMQQLGLSLAMTMKIYKRYGADCVRLVKENPYRLIEDVENIGFKTADKIAFEAGVEAESEFRLTAGIRYALSFAATEGNTCLPKDKLVMFAANNVLGVPVPLVEDMLASMVENGKLFAKTIGDEEHVFLPYMFKTELSAAAKLDSVAKSVEILPFYDIEYDISRLEKKYRIELAPLQREAIKRSIADGVLVITGGPGTGKTTILRFIIDLFIRLDLEFELAAPTGRAAKRISDTTGTEARTLHRLLEYSAGGEGFNRNDECPIETDAIIVDEMSMVDASLFAALVKAIAPGTRFVMVGDVDQLPSVGPGNVLKDIVDSDIVPVIRLNEIFRQAGRSSIVTNAHLVNNGKMPSLGTEDDFQFYFCPNAKVALDSVLNLCGDYAYLGRSNDLQVLSPMKANVLGVHNLNAELQKELNPPAEEKNEYTYGDTVFREGDRVMQIRNNYDLEWKKTKGKLKTVMGTGVFNGDIGTVMQIDSANRTVGVLFDDERYAEYNYPMLEELELAYCISVHKSQGSEFATVVLPLVSGPNMLFNRNILYTAITRARERVIILGTEECISFMVSNTNVRRRYSALGAFLKEIKGGISV